MKLAITSDLHIGDDWCTLVGKSTGGGYQPGPKYGDFVNAVGKDRDYLVLVGDVFDFSVAGYVEPYKMARDFFSRLAADCSPRAMVFMPGNHDYSFWHWVELQVNVIDRIAGGEDPRPFKWSVPGVVDERKGAGKGLHLAGVSKKPGTEPYGGLFLDALTKGAGAGPGIPFYVVYPNLYLVNKGGTVLVTHGHYLESYWSLISQFGPEVLEDDLPVGGFMDMKELVAVNVPLNELASASIGQAGPFSRWIRFIQHQIKGKKFDEVKRYLENLDDKIWDPLMNYWSLNPQEWSTDLLADLVKRKILEGFESTESSRYNKQFLRLRAVRTRLPVFYGAVTDEVSLLSQDPALNAPGPIAPPLRVIYGHTHTPVSWESTAEKQEVNGNYIRFHNMGGWLHSDMEPGQGAEVFHWDDGVMTSTFVPPQ